MRFILLPVLLFSIFSLFAKTYNINNFDRLTLINLIDTTVNPENPVNPNETKITISKDANAVEFSPSASFNEQVVIQPINRSTNKGLSTAFYLVDTSSWVFYTNARERLKINGTGEIKTSSALLVNNASSDGVSALRVKGAARFDSAVYIQSFSDTNSFISFHRSAKSANLDADDGISPYTTTPTAWVINHNLPVFRIRHPNNVSGVANVNVSIQRDFMIVPYESGIAIEYNGVVECWVGEWSIHKGVYYNDIEGKGNGWGAVLWVGDDVDRGGIRTTARNNTSIGGNVAYGELSVEKFGGSSNGDLRLRLPSTQNEFQFVYGERGSENIFAKLTKQGLVIPTVSSAASIANPQQALILFDSTDKSFRGYNGNSWVNLSDNNLKFGSYSQSTNGSLSVFTINHGLGVVPGYFNVVPTKSAAADISYLTANSVSIFIYYTTPPPAGTNNLSWTWQARKQ